MRLYGLFEGAALLLGLVVGSFLNVCIVRLPRDLSVVWPPSHCTGCGHAIRWYDNVPVLSWLVLRGRCRDCGGPISSLYPAVELLTGLVAWLLYRRVVPEPDALDLAHGVAFVVAFGFACLLIGQSFIDIRWRIIPDSFSIYAVPVGVGASALLAWLGYPHAIGWQRSVVGALVGGGVLVGVPLAWWLFRTVVLRLLGRRPRLAPGDLMGWGDVKLLAMIGAFLGAVPAVPFVLFAASLVGAAVAIAVMTLRGLRAAWQADGGPGARLVAARRAFGHLGLAVPFGPFLALGAMLFMLHGREMLEHGFPAGTLLFGTGWP